jgi:hypothetical protein
MFISCQKRDFQKVFVHFYHNSNPNEIHIVLSSNFEFIRRIADLNYLLASDKFIQRIVHFYPLDSAIQASYNAIFTPDKIYPLHSDVSTG